MALNDRSMGYQLSNVEREIACNPKYENVGYVRHDRAEGYFFLDYSPYKRNDREEIFYSYGLRPPEGEYAEVRVEEEKYQVFDYFKDHWVNIRSVSGWKEFDVGPLARQRKIMDFREIIEYFTQPYDGEADSIEEIAGCSALFAFSAPPVSDESGGIHSAVFGKKNQWDLFRRPFDIIPTEFRKDTSYYYYLFSNNDVQVRKTKGEINQAILKPRHLVADIPVAMDHESRHRISPDYREILKEESAIVTGQLLDGLLITPKSTDIIEKAMREAVYELREEYYTSGQRPFRQNISGAIPKLASSYARLQSNSVIHKEDIRYVMDLWSAMSHKTGKIQSSSLKVADAFTLTGEARNLYYRLYDVFGADYAIPFGDAVKIASLEPIEFKLARDSLYERGYCLIGRESLTLLEPYKKE